MSQISRRLSCLLCVSAFAMILLPGFSEAAAKKTAKINLWDQYESDLASGKLDDAIKVTDQIALKYPKAPHTWTLRALPLLAKKEFTQALTSLDKTKTADQQEEYWAFRFEALREISNTDQKRHPEALIALQKTFGIWKKPTTVFLARAENFLIKFPNAEVAGLLCGQLKGTKLTSSLCPKSAKRGHALYLALLQPAYAEDESAGDTSMFGSLLNWFSKNVLQMAPVQRMVHWAYEKTVGTDVESSTMEMCTEPISDKHLAGKSGTNWFTNSFLAGAADHVFLNIKENDKNLIYETNGGGTEKGAFNTTYDERGSKTCENIWIPSNYSESEYRDLLKNGSDYLIDKYKYNYDFINSNCGGWAKLVIYCLGGSVSINPNFGVSSWHSGSWEKKSDGKTMTGDQVCEDLKDHVGFKPEPSSSSSSTPTTPPTPAAGYQ